MINFKKTSTYYLIGIGISFVFIGIIYLYSFLFEAYFSYANLENVVVVVLLSGVPFGFSIWVFHSILKNKKPRTDTNVVKTVR